MMRETRRGRWGGRLAAFLLAVAMVLSLATGCHHGGPGDGIDRASGNNDSTESGGAGESGGTTEPGGNDGTGGDSEPDGNGGGDEDGESASPVPTNTQTGVQTNVQVGAEIDTLNVILVIDTSSSTIQNDPAHNWLEASCMFLHTLYASANKQKVDRLPGSKKANVDVILYNDTYDLYSDLPMDLATKDTVDTLNTFIRSGETKARLSANSGDDALSDALDKAVKILSARSQGEEKLSERSVILLLTDGYTPLGSTSPLPAVQTSAPAQAEAPSGGGSATAATYDSTFPREHLPTPSIPDFGDSHRATLESAVNSARDNNIEIIVLMQNYSGSRDGGWEQFKELANGTERNFMEKIGPALGRLRSDPRFAKMPRSMEELTWPEGYEMLRPAFMEDPMFGGGVFSNPDNREDKVNYMTAETPWQLMSFYASMAANMLSGSSASQRTPKTEKLERNGRQEEHYRYDVNVPDHSVSAMMCFFFSEEGIEGITLKGPNPNEPGSQTDYEDVLQRQDKEGWAKGGTMRNDWYTHRNSSGESQNNLVTLTIVNPDPGLWSVYVYGKDGVNRPLHTYVSFVNGSTVNIAFSQGYNPDDKDHPVTSGDFAVQVNDAHDDPLGEDFYAPSKLRTRCTITRIPPWFPVSGDADIKRMMETPDDWAQQVLNDFKEPTVWLTEMTGGEIDFTPSVYDDGTPILAGSYDSHLPGLYYVTLTMIAGENDVQLDYSKSFWVRYAVKTDRQIIIDKVGRESTLFPPYLPDNWTKTSNTANAEDLRLTLVDQSWKVSPDGFADVNPDSKNPEALIVHANQQGQGTLTFDVTTEYGDRWTIQYDVIVNRR